MRTWVGGRSGGMMARACVCVQEWNACVQKLKYPDNYMTDLNRFGCKAG